MNLKLSPQYINLSALAACGQKPDLDAKGEALFWQDPYIARQMLKTHLDPNTDLASRKPEIIDKSVAWMFSQVNLKPGSRILDLGCGPGLYTVRFARRGCRVTGMDFSKNSIEYAGLLAHQEGLDIEYIYQDYLTLDYEGVFDAITLIYYDLGVLAETDRLQLLTRVARALKPGGFFIFDVVTEYFRSKEKMLRNWNLCLSDGFWRPGPYLELYQPWDYPEEQAFLDQYLIIEESGKLSVYNIWEHELSKGKLYEELTRSSFAGMNFWSDLVGSPYLDHSGTIGVIARK
jgi:SAM-dependent methyltransferase